ncbi:hypothetical protein N7492_007661 [Penicillium capsulatum]|uniref:Uncharacterized protein n=1 Tax=Penicillium capsulatum TaxID=69766 RepID=A0A9W9I0C0_9EURO|nr:hypothetical protein N7492_007661 [Penicillium capsulatum]
MSQGFVDLLIVMKRIYGSTTGYGRIVPLANFHGGSREYTEADADESPSMIGMCILERPVIVFHVEYGVEW